MTFKMPIYQAHLNELYIVVINGQYTAFIFFLYLWILAREDMSATVPATRKRLFKSTYLKIMCSLQIQNLWLQLFFKIV